MCPFSSNIPRALISVYKQYLDFETCAFFWLEKGLCMAVIPRNTTSVFKGFGWRIILDRFYYRCYFNDAAGHYLNYVPCGQSVYTREHAAAAHPWDMYPRHFHACANVAILSLLYVPAARPCYVSPQFVLHTFCRCMSLQHITATCPALNISIFSYGPGVLPFKGYIGMCGPKG